MIGDVLIFGPPGSGKGTQAGLLCDRRGFRVISTGDMLRSKLLSESKDSAFIQATMVNGSLLPDEFVFEMVKLRLEDCVGPVVFDGFPRNLVQARMLSQFYYQNCSERVLCLAIEFEVSDLALWDRVSSRYICRGCGAVLSIPVGSNLGVCVLCGSSCFETRFDDNKEVFSKRLQEYKDFMISLRDYYENIMERIDAMGTVEEVFLRLVKVLEKLS